MNKMHKRFFSFCVENEIETILEINSKTITKDKYCADFYQAIHKFPFLGIKKENKSIPFYVNNTLSVFSYFFEHSSYWNHSFRENQVIKIFTLNDFKKKFINYQLEFEF